MPKPCRRAYDAWLNRGDLAATCDAHRLYTFADGSGTSVTGNNVEGFKVARVLRSC